ncbi:helix-turn-helix domain-containing protein [Chitinimonas sp.]|uniref:helix-turn-helix domain-containing protein n=1 Tax=Chitinimonas sp. TaxID=1934313 RepID=UPI0035B01E09
MGNWLLLIAFGQGVFLALALIAVRQPQPSRLPARLLAALVLVFALIIGHAWLAGAGRFDQSPRLASAIAPLPLLIGPLLWLHLCSLLRAERARRAWAWHFLPFGLALVAWLPHYLGMAPAAAAGERGALPWYLAGFGLAKAVLIVAYLLPSHRLIAEARQAQTGWALLGPMHALVRGLLVGLLGVAALFVAEAAGLPVPVSSDNAGATVLTLFVYSLALCAMRLPMAPAPATSPAATTKPAPDVGELVPFLDKLRQSMERDEMFRDGELSLEQLASHLALTPHELSRLVNQVCQVSFQEYLNAYRVAALKQAMLAPQNDGATILDLAMAAGFNSKSSLNRVFKQHTGMTPTQFRQQGMVDPG